jgi:hypothetical protein
MLALINPIEESHIDRLGIIKAIIDMMATKASLRATDLRGSHSGATYVLYTPVLN